MDCFTYTIVHIIIISVILFVKLYQEKINDYVTFLLNTYVIDILIVVFYIICFCLIISFIHNFDLWQIITTIFIYITTFILAQMFWIHIIFFYVIFF